MSAIEKSPSNRPQNGNELKNALLSLSPDDSDDQSELIEEDQIEIISDKRSYDFASIFLSLVALIVAGGLIPFWIYVIFSLNIFRSN